MAPIRRMVAHGDGAAQWRYPRQRCGISPEANIGNLKGFCRCPNTFRTNLAAISGGYAMSLTDEEKRRVFEEERIRREMQGKSALVAVILSVLIPGLGDLYCGSWIKAIVFFVLNILSFILMFFAIGFFVYF